MNFFQSLIDYVQAFFSYLINIIENLITAVGLLIQLPTIVNTLVGYVPPIIGTCCIVIVSVAVVKLIVGWGNV